MDTVHIPAMEVPVIAEVDVLVVGGGPSGTAAAICAARGGATTMLVDRSGYLGGLATGGLVILLADMDNGEEITVAGIVDEFQERLDRRGGLVRPPREAWFKASVDLHRTWFKWGLLDERARGEPFPVGYRSLFDVEIGKQVLFEMVDQSGVQLRLHSWCVTAIVEGRDVKGAVFFSKSGYQAVRAKLTIDATGDGDVFASAGADHVHGSFMITLPHYFANVDTERAERLWFEDRGAARELDKEVKSIYGGTWHQWWRKSAQPGVVWVNAPHIPGYDGLKVEDLTYLEVEARRRIFRVLEFVRDHYPGFEDCYLAQTADRIGVRQTRLLAGEYVLTEEDVKTGKRFDDSVGRGKGYYYPYRCFLPKRLESLLVAGRHVSMTPKAQHWAREWPPCMVTGQAVGTAAALALEGGVRLREVDVSALQGRLQAQGVIL